MQRSAKWTGNIVIPELPERRHKVGDNLIIQRPFERSKQMVRVYSSRYSGYYQAHTEMGGKFSRFLLRKKGSRRVSTSLPVLSSSSFSDLEDLAKDIEFLWDDVSTFQNYMLSPNEVLKAWYGKFSFRIEDGASPGFRAPQVGALHAICAHFSIGNKFDAATVVLPTGTGKTETMLAMQVYCRLPKTLVIVPSDALRYQISQKFVSLGILPDVEAVPREIARPFVAILSKGLRTVDEAREILDKSNVIVTLPNTIRASDGEAIEALMAGCTDLIVDEAHHISAPEWSKIRDNFVSKRITQFTATPFRQDNKRIDGKIIFNFKLGDAQALGYYRSISLKTVEEYGDEETKDRKIAIEAIASLRHDRDEMGLDHLIMARTRSKNRAEKVLRLYEELAPDFNPLVVYSGPGRATENQIALKRLFDKSSTGSRILVCVDMLGEGFDLPNLKIAALHDTHKSLAVTLQFIGRFTRKGAMGEIGDATVIANIADPEMETKLENLYAEGADWDMLIRRLSEERIEDELKLQEVVLGLKEDGNLHSQLSLWNLRPSLSTKIYRTVCTDWQPHKYRDALPKGTEAWHSISQEQNILVSVVYRTSGVDWGNYQNLIETSYDLILIYWNKEENALFVYSSDYQSLRIERLVKEITSEGTSLLCGPAIFNILNNVELPLVKNLGSSRVGAISFTSYFGPNVTEGLASIEKAESELNNIACLGYENGERVLWGAAQRKGKIWQHKSASLSDWVIWCDRTWQKVSDDRGVGTNVTRDFLRPEKLDKPYTSMPISVQWGEQAQVQYNDKQFIQFDKYLCPLYMVGLSIGSISEDGSFNIDVFCDEKISTINFHISNEFPGGYKYTKVSGPDIFYVKSNGLAVEFNEHLLSDPFIIRYADGTYSYNCYHIPVNLEAGTYPRDRIEYWDWGGIPLNQESMHKERNINTIQYRVFEIIRDEYDIIFNDDGCGEAADLVAFKGIDSETIRLCLIHCKGAIGGNISNNIHNFYTVCGQAQKSVTVKHAGIKTLYYDLKRREEIWARESVSRFLKGDMKLLSYYKEKARKSKLEFEVLIVQPGASSVSVSDDILKLLATTELFLVKTTQAIFRVIVSA